jgi:hypothetical protein
MYLRIRFSKRLAQKLKARGDEWHSARQGNADEMDGCDRGASTCALRLYMGGQGTGWRSMGITGVA